MIYDSSLGKIIKFYCPFYLFHVVIEIPFSICIPQVTFLNKSYVTPWKHVLNSFNATFLLWYSQDVS